MACVFPVTEPSKGTIGPSPFQEKHLQNILLGLCFMVTAIQSGFNSSPGSCHTFPFLSYWNCVKVLLFEKSTLLHCLVVHFSRVQAYSRWAWQCASVIVGLRKGTQVLIPTFLRLWHIVFSEIGFVWAIQAVVSFRLHHKKCCNFIFRNNLSPT